MKKIFLFIATILFLTLPANVLAVCPACIVAEGVGIGVLRWLGIDDIIVGIWIGAMCISMVLWLNNLLIKRNKKYFAQLPILIVLIYLPNLWFLDKAGLLNNFRPIFGINRLLIGTVYGSIIVFIALFIDNYLRMKNNGKVKFYYQKIIIPISLLTAASLIFFFLWR